ncbi:MAG: hypothetical protein PF450_03455, partial [Bacteroidales bacterium]|nr:hypothetical protein [Bacteroidales bacterium]
MSRKIIKSSFYILILVLLSACGNTKNEKMDNKAEDWEQSLEEQIKLLGHRNWVVVADAAYPLQSRNGIKTILSSDSHEETVAKVNKQLASEQHVQAIIHLDKVIDFVDEKDAHGINDYKAFLSTTFNADNPLKELHTDIIKKLDEAASLYNVLIIKTEFTIPYTTVFFELDCA